MANYNIKPRWKPGQSGNPAGRPKGSKSIPDLLRRYGDYTTPAKLITNLRTLFPKLPKDITLQDSLWLSVYLHAIKGQSWAVSIIADRLEGKVPLPIPGLAGVGAAVHIHIGEDGADDSAE